MNVMSGREKKKKNELKPLKEKVDYCNDLNKFYSKFDCHDFKKNREEVKNKLEERFMSVNERIV